jgi:hypothetical protein
MQWRKFFVVDRAVSRLYTVSRLGDEDTATSSNMMVRLGIQLLGIHLVSSGRAGKEGTYCGKMNRLLQLKNEYILYIDVLRSCLSLAYHYSNGFCD